MIVVRIWEGLGNQLFQYAYARALQIRTGEKVALDVTGIYKTALEGDITKRVYALDKFRIKLPVVCNMEKKYFFLEQRKLLHKALFKLAQKNLWPYRFYKERDILYKNELRYVYGNQYLMGWFQNEQYFEEYREILLKDLSPKKKIKISSRLERILNKEETVSVHIRRSDFIKYNNALPVSYYRRAKIYLEEHVATPFYLIFSDDTEWVREKLDLGERVFYMAEEKLQDYEELLIMSRCRHNIIANSTFSWWGAWLNQNHEKIVIGPRMWYKKLWFKTDQHELKCNIMPDEWKRI